MIKLLTVLKKYRVIRYITALMMLLFVVFGCIHKNFYHSTNGKNLTLGIADPNAKYISINALNDLDGYVVDVKEASCIMHEFQIAESNNYCNLVFINTSTKSKIQISPTNLTEVTSKK